MPLAARWCLGLGLGLAAVLASSARADTGTTKKGTTKIDFGREIRPILAEKCLNCHSGDEPEGGLRLGERESALRAGDGGLAAIVPGRPAESELVRRISSADVDERMPPADEKQLTVGEIEKLKQWIAEGAEWSGHWAFQPLGNPQPPQVKQPEWVRNDIDRFVLARLEQQGFTPSPAADRYTLIKRLHYDLVGLPPSIEEVDAFVRDPAPDAYAQLVERLLKSPHFGERWGRHWLDLAHFADSDGYEKDRARPDAFLWRDWVISAINNDMPFDQFTIEQLAGDLLPGATAQQRIATGFLRQTLTNEEGGVDQEEYRIAACFDRTETVGTVWLALTIGCVRCHGHKYDPLPHEEYYRFFAFFNNAEEVTQQLPVAADNLSDLENQLRPLESSLAERGAELAPQLLAWETAEHQRILAQPEGALSERPVEIVSIESAGGAPLPFEVQGDLATWLGTSPAAGGGSEGTGNPAASGAVEVAEKDNYVITVRLPESRVTGLKLYVLPDDRLPGSGPGLSSDGQFVLTGIEIAPCEQGGGGSPVALHRAKADAAQGGFSAEQVLLNDASGKQGWAAPRPANADKANADKANANKAGPNKAGPNKVDSHQAGTRQATAAHWIQFRTREPLRFDKGGLLRAVLFQQHGGRQLLGKFRLAALTGDERGLHLSNEAIARALEMYPEKRVASTRQQLFDYFVTDVVRDERIRELHRRVAELHQRYHARLADVRTIGVPRLPRTTRLFHRGDFLTPQDAVAPGVPAILAAFRPRSAAADRLDLAQWLVAPDNFLTPRVAVNHVWGHLFGHALVRTPSDFGTRGEAPSHPELLDWLAGRFHGEMKWSRKELLRWIVNSATYQQASHFRPELEVQDPRNELLFRQNRFRVESEIVRDINLAVSGLLATRIGGPSVFPPMPEDLAKLSYANNFTWKNSQGEDRYRRGMYTFFKRTIPHPSLMTFDSPDANVACVERTVSNTPLQSLTLLNNESHVEAAQAFARRLLTDSGSTGDGSDRTSSTTRSPSRDESRLMTALRLCIARPPRDAEVQALQRVLEESRSYYAQHPDEAKLLANRHLPPDVPIAETAAWVATVRVVLNLDEFVNRE